MSTLLSAQWMQNLWPGWLLYCAWWLLCVTLTGGRLAFVRLPNTCKQLLHRTCQSWRVQSLETMQGAAGLAKRLEFKNTVFTSKLSVFDNCPEISADKNAFNIISPFESKTPLFCFLTRAVIEVWIICTARNQFVWLDYSLGLNSISDSLPFYPFSSLSQILSCL